MAQTLLKHAKLQLGANVVLFHKTQVLSVLPLTIYLLSGVQSTSVTASLCFVRVVTLFAFFAFQTIKVLSSEADITTLLSTDQATVVTGLICPEKVATLT